jgi:two-component system OmpR family response regulator
LRILLLEDELMLQSSIEEYLKGLGHSVNSFSNPIRVLDSLNESKYDILILDINVPQFDGLKLYETILQKSIQKPTIFISAQVDIETISRAFNLGAEDYLKKPFHLKELGIRVQKISKSIENSQREHMLLTENYSYSKKNMTLLYKNEPQKLTKNSNKSFIVCA